MSSTFDDHRMITFVPFLMKETFINSCSFID